MEHVLFVCTHIAGRSQMAEALFNRAAPEDIRAESAGQAPGPRIWPEVVTAMRELDIDLEHKRPKKLLPEMQLHADWAVTLACSLRAPCRATLRSAPASSSWRPTPLPRAARAT